MSRFMKVVGVTSFATLCLALGACTANEDCCKEEQGTQVNASVMSEKKKEGCCSANKETQVNASVMSEKKAGCCSAKSEAECKEAAPKN